MIHFILTAFLANKVIIGFRITPNIASTVYCTAIKFGNQSDWNNLWKNYEQAILATDYITILKGLGCSRDTAVLEGCVFLYIEDY